MYNYGLHQHVNQSIQEAGLDISGADNLFYTRFIVNTSTIFGLYMQLYEHHPRAEQAFHELIKVIIKAHTERSKILIERDNQKTKEEHWFLSNEIGGMSLYVDRICGNLQNLQSKLNYLETLGVNFLHLMPLFETTKNESDGVYAVSDFSKIYKRFGDLEDLSQLQQRMQKRKM